MAATMEGESSVYAYPLVIKNSFALGSSFGGHCMGFVLSSQTSTSIADKWDFMHPGMSLRGCGTCTKGAVVLDKLGQLLTLILLLCRVRFFTREPGCDAPP